MKSKSMKSIFQFTPIYILAFLFLLITEILIALYVHDRFIRPYFGDVLVIVLIYCFLRIFIKPYRLLPIYIFLLGVLVEIVQYFQLTKIFGLDKNRILAVILGQKADLLDIFCYFVGCMIIYICIYFYSLILQKSCLH